MRLKVLTGVLTALALAGLVSTASAQSDRPMVAVMDFDYSAVNNWWSGVWGNYDIGKGVADQVVDELINESDFRVIERKRIDTVLAEQDFQQSDDHQVHDRGQEVLGGGNREGPDRWIGSQEVEERGPAQRADHRRRNRGDLDRRQGQG
jgi:curli biogenesis system outer membrane secretion channel CsgG